MKRIILGLFCVMALVGGTTAEAQSPPNLLDVVVPLVVTTGHPFPVSLEYADEDGDIIAVIVVFKCLGGNEETHEFASKKMPGTVKGQVTSRLRIDNGRGPITLTFCLKDARGNLSNEISREILRN